MAERIKKIFSYFPSELKNVPATVITAVTVAILVAILVEPIRNFFRFLFTQLLSYLRILGIQFQQLWLLHSLILALGIILTIYLLRERRRVDLLAGTFKDDFKSGLSNWDFDGENWSVHESEKEDTYLEVTNSGQGGISRKGFKLDNYLFSFRAKIINSASGWIVRAEDRSKYFMIQCLIIDPKNKVVRIRPHFLIDEVYYLVEEKDILNEKITSKVIEQEWFDVEIEVKGNDINLYIENEFVYHYELPSPIRVEDKWQTVSPSGNISPTTEGDTQTEAKLDSLKRAEELSIILSRIKSISFVSGRVGFRCWGPEKSWIKSVRVKPIL